MYIWIESIGCQIFSYWICVGSICDSSGPLLEVVNVEEVLLEVKVVFSGLYGKSFGKFYPLVSKDQRSKLCQMENDINCSKYVNIIIIQLKHCLLMSSDTEVNKTNRQKFLKVARIWEFIPDLGQVPGTIVQKYISENSWEP